MSLTLRFDFDLPYDRPEGGYNRGCPPGYFAQFVYSGDIDAQRLPGNDPNMGIRCRLMPDLTQPPEAVSADIAEINQESGTSWSETADMLNQAIQQTGVDIAGRPLIDIPWMTLVLVLAGLWLTDRWVISRSG